MEFKYKISVIVPIYNVEKYLEYCLKSLINQTIDKKDMEVLLINDGSPDNSEAICKKYCEKYPFFKYFKKENEGLSKTRNYGLRHAEGKYIVFLDSDDALTEPSLKGLVEFFDEHEDEVDIVTYKIVPFFEGKQAGPLHYRYKHLIHEGVYDLTLPENYFITQTNVNVCVKNMGKDNVYFYEGESYHEDQQYNTEIICKKMKIGYCTKAKYLYTKNPSSITNTSFYAYYIFESTTKYWEELFASFNGKVPPYVQAMFLNDINWKTKTDILLPYHYEGEKFQNAIDRLCNLIKQLDDDVIMNHPEVTAFHSCFLFGIKYDNKLDVTSGCGGAVISYNGKPLFTENPLTFIISRFKVDNDKVFIDAFLKSPTTSFTDDVEIYATFSGNGKSEKITLNKEKSAWDYYLTKIKTNRFFRVRLDWNYKKYSAVSFSVNLCGTVLPVKLDFANNVPFSLSNLRTKIYRCAYAFFQNQGGFCATKANENEERKYREVYTNELMLKKPRTFLRRKALIKKNLYDKKIWLYYDCKNVYKDNGYYQFIHDFEKDDGVERYYVVNDNMDRKELFTPKQRKHIIRFGTLKHKRYFLAAEKIITAFAEYNNYNPFLQFVWKYYSDLFRADVIYLQHGVLHAFLPWKYSSDRFPTIDKEVISTTFEVENFTKNYGFRDCDLIKSGMPRYDFIDIEDAKSENKILFAPTWRKYIIGMDRNGSFFPTPAKFKNSDFFKETHKLLTSKELEETLEKNDWYLDFKLHPIFSPYASLYQLNNKRIRIADKSVDEKSYKVFITDFSSFCFDFVYLKKTMMYFVPDNEMFRAGMNDYRKLDLPLEDGFGPLAQNADEALKAIIDIVNRNGEAEEHYKSKMDNFFLNSDKNCRERIYNQIK